MDQEQPFNPQDVEQQVDQLSSYNRKTYGTSHPEQRFLHDLRLVLAAEEGENQAREDLHSLQYAWERIEALGISPQTIQREHPRSKHRETIAMSTIPSKPHARSLSPRNRSIRRLSTLVALIVAFILVGTVVFFALTSHSQHAKQPDSSIGGKPNANQMATSYVHQQAGNAPIFDVQWSPDGTRIISSNENVSGWDAFTGAHPVTYVNAPKSLLSLSTQVSPDGKQLAVWKSNQIDIYDTATGRHLTSLTYPFSQTSHASFLRSINWSHDGKFIGTLVENIDLGMNSAVNNRVEMNQLFVNKLVTYTVATGTYHEQQIILTELLREVSWSPDGEYVAVGRPSLGIVSVVKVATGQIVANMNAGKAIDTIPLSWSPDSHKLSANLDGNRLTVWNATGVPLDIQFYTDGTQPSWSPNGKYIALINDKFVKVLDASTGTLLHTYTTTGALYSLAWSPDSHALAAGGTNANNTHGIVNVWKVAI